MGQIGTAALASAGFARYAARMLGKDLFYSKRAHANTRCSMTEKCPAQSVLSTIRAARLVFARKRISTLRSDIPFPISARRVHRPSRPQCRRRRVPDSCAKVDEPRKLTRYHTLTYALHCSKQSNADLSIDAIFARHAGYGH